MSLKTGEIPTPTASSSLARLWSYRTRLGDLFLVSRDLLNARWRLRHCTRQPLARIAGNPRIVNRGQLIVGEKVLIDSEVARVELVANRGARLEIGAHSYINYGTSISAHALVKIGQHCHIGTYCNVADNDFHSIEDRQKLPPSAPVILEDNVWLGAKVIVLKGVTIGHDSVIGAGSVVTRDIPPRSIAVGQPARVIKTF